MSTQRVNWEASVRLAARLDIRPRDCFVNCADALVRTPELAGWRYVEGFMLTPTEPAALMEHGWLLTSWGAIVDPTLALCVGVPARLYIPARCYTRTQMAPHVEQRGWLPLMARYHETAGRLIDLRDPAVRAAWQRGRLKLRAYSHVLPQMHEAAAEVFAAAVAQQEQSGL